MTAMSAGLLAELADQLNGMDAKEVEDSVTMLVPPGKYHAVLDEVDDEIVTDNGNRGFELTYTLLGGTKPGKKVTHTLYTRSNKGEKEQRKLNQQINLFALRHGIATKDANDKTQLLPGKSFSNAIGTEVILQVVVESGTNKKGRPWEGNGVKFCGVFALDDPKAREGAHLATEEAKKAVADKRQKDDLSEIEV